MEIMEIFAGLLIFFPFLTHVKINLGVKQIRRISEARIVVNAFVTEVRTAVLVRVREILLIPVLHLCFSHTAPLNLFSS